MSETYIEVTGNIIVHHPVKKPEVSPGLASFVAAMEGVAIWAQNAA